MGYRVNECMWQELMYLINNFFVPIKYTCGKGVYPDRVTFKRARVDEELLAPQKDVEFFIMNARSKEDSKTAIRQIRSIVESKVTDSFIMNNAINVGNLKRNDYTNLFNYVQSKLVNTGETDYKILNNFITKVYKNLDTKDALKIAQFRENALDFCVEQGYISNDFAIQEKNELPNSMMKLSVDLGNQL